METERASSTRQREHGCVCCRCRASLPPPYPGRERLCDRCNPPKHRVYMHFMHARMGWYCQFLLPDLKTPLRRTFTFKTKQKVIELALRGGADISPMALKELGDGVELGRGDCWLSLDDEQFRLLQ